MKTIFNSKFRSWMMVVLLLMASSYVALTPVTKIKAGERINLSGYVPRSFLGWESIEYDMKDYQDQWQSINEIIARKYTNIVTGKFVYLIVEYSSDLRQNFTFHFPENCFRAGGNEVSQLGIFNINLPDNRILPTKSLYVRALDGKTDEGDKVIDYWLVIDKKQYSRTLSIKLDQLLAGLVNKSKKGFLIRVDSAEGIHYSDQKIAEINATMSSFIRDLYLVLDQEKREALFGNGKLLSAAK